MTDLILIYQFFIKSLWAIIPFCLVMLGGAIYEKTQR